MSVETVLDGIADLTDEQRAAILAEVLTANVLTAIYGELVRIRKAVEKGPEEEEDEEP